LRLRRQPEVWLLSPTGIDELAVCARLPSGPDVEAICLQEAKGVNGGGELRRIARLDMPQ